MQSKDGAATRGRAWTKQAVAADAGTTVTVGRHGHHQGHHVGRGLPLRRRHLVGHGLGQRRRHHAGTSSHHPLGRRGPGRLLAGQLLEREVLRPADRPGPRPPASTTRATPRGHRRRQGQLPAGRLRRPRRPPARPPAAPRPRASPAAAHQLFSVVVSPGTSTTPPPTGNVAPVPRSPSSCSSLTCSFNASATTDANNDPLTYAWNFGDGSTGTGVTTSRTYASAATRTVTLTVNDGTTTAHDHPLGHHDHDPGRSAPAGARATPRLVPETARTDLPKISNGEIWDIKVVGSRVFIAGSFTSDPEPAVEQHHDLHRSGLASYNLTTGLVDTGLQPEVHRWWRRRHRVHARQHQALRHRQLQRHQRGGPKRGLASLNLTTGAPLTGFTANLSARGSEIVATNSHASTSAAASPRSTASPGSAWLPSTPAPAPSTPASSTTSPAASASTVPSPCSDC